MHRLSFALLPFLLIASSAHAQQFAINQDNSEISVDGTSNNTPHWTVYATEFSGSITVAGTHEDGGTPTVEAVTLTVPTRMIKSRKSGIMDRVMYDALDVKTHTEITFALTSVSDLEVIDDASGRLVANGDLTLGGQTNAVSIPVDVTIGEDGMVQFTGTHTIAFKDYGMKPPTAMFGSLRTGSTVDVSATFNVGPIQ